MSLQPRPIEAIPEETARLARALYPRGNVYLTLRDELGPIFEDADFADLYPRRGQPAWAPWRLALVCLFQYAEGLSDRQAAEMVCDRISWKYALGLEVTDPGFDASVLSEFRDRLLGGQASTRVLDLLLERCRAAGLIKERGRQRTDSTHVLGAIRALNRLCCVGETVRHALNTLAEAAPDWLREHLDPAWPQRYGARFEEYRLPRGKAARQALAEQVGADGSGLLAALAEPDAPAELRRLPAVETLRQVWVQQYHGPATPIRWRQPADLPPWERLIVTPYDPDVRGSRKRTTEWMGYKAHLTETCDPDRPLLITHVETTAATLPDVAVTERILTDLARTGRLPGDWHVDAGYVDADVLAWAAAEHQVRLIGPVALDTTWQARASEGFAAADFLLDWDRQQVTCPRGQTSARWVEGTARDTAIVTVTFARATCAACSDRARCTKSPTAPRSLKLRSRPAHQALVARRQEQATAAFRELSAPRAGIEGGLSQAIRRTDLRHARYVGLSKLALQQVLSAGALNLLRLGDWFIGRPRAQTRRSPLTRLPLAS